MRLMLVVLLLVGAACAPAPRELTPREVLDRAADELDKANTAHFTLEQQNGSVQLAAGVQIVNAEGDVQRPDKLRMKFTLRLAGFSAESQLIAVGEDLFLTNPLSGQWQKAPAATGAPRVLDPGDLWVGNDDFLPRQVRLEGPIGAGDTTATVRVLKFSQFNAAVTIDRPI